MKFAQDIVLAPVITENSMAGIADKKYTFKVATDATKIDIANAVEELFGVKVAKVNTISVRGRYRRQGMHAGYTAKSKKAIVTLTADSKEIADNADIGINCRNAPASQIGPDHQKIFLDFQRNSTYKRILLNAHISAHMHGNLFFYQFFFELFLHR